jgi:sulfonate transport system permease protein
MKRLGKNIMLPALLLRAWVIAARFEIFSPYLLPSPQKTFSVFWALLLDGTLARHLAVSLLRVVGGFLCSCLVAMPLGLLCGRSRVLHDFLEPILEFLRHVPPLAAIPLIILCSVLTRRQSLSSFFSLPFSRSSLTLTAASGTATETA